MSRSLPILAVLALCAGAALRAQEPTDDDVQIGTQEKVQDLWFVPDTGVVGIARTTLWPDRVVVDAKTWMLLAVWNTDPPRQEAIAMSDVASIERARPFEGHPDEVVAVLRDGRRILLARGANAGTAATLLSAVVGRSVTEVERGEGWTEPTRDDGAEPDTTLALGSVHSGAAVATLIEEEKARRAASGEAAAATERTVISVDEALPANADPGALSPAIIRATVQASMGGFRACYLRELRRNPQLQGKVVVRFIIEEDGSVSHARLRETTINNEVVEQCVVRAVGELEFPPPQAGKVVPVSFPFNFTAG